MSFFDMLTLIVAFFLIIIVSLASLYVWNITAPQLGAPANVTTAFNDSINETVGFWDTSFAAMFVLLGIASIVLTIFLASNPALLLAWILMNMATLFVWDQLNDVLTIFLTMPFDGGQMNTAIAFFQTGIPMAVPILNLIMGVVIFGKRVFTQ